VNEPETLLDSEVAVPITVLVSLELKKLPVPVGSITELEFEGFP